MFDNGFLTIIVFELFCRIVANFQVSTIMVLFTRKEKENWLAFLVCHNLYS